MANNITRRTPIVRKLPSGFNDLENINYLSLTNIKGLQIYDNPFAADQSSTYNSNNVYRDELGNLTVRPALVNIDTSANTGYGTASWYYKDITGNEFIIYSNKLWCVGWIDYSLDTNSIVTVQEYANNLGETTTYFLVSDNNSKLKFLKFDNEEHQFIEVTGDILKSTDLVPDQNIVEDIDPKYYNILNDKVKYIEYKNPIGVRDSSYYELATEITVSDVLWYEALQHIWLSNNVYIVIAVNSIRVYALDGYWKEVCKYNLPSQISMTNNDIWIDENLATKQCSIGIAYLEEFTDTSITIRCVRLLLYLDAYQIGILSSKSYTHEQEGLYKYQSVKVFVTDKKFGAIYTRYPQTTTTDSFIYCRYLIGSDTEELVDKAVTVPGDGDTSMNWVVAFNESATNIHIEKSTYSAGIKTLIFGIYNNYWQTYTHASTYTEKFSILALDEETNTFNCIGQTSYHIPFGGSSNIYIVGTNDSIFLFGSYPNISDNFSIHEYSNGMLVTLSMVLDNKYHERMIQSSAHGIIGWHDNVNSGTLENREVIFFDTQFRTLIEYKFDTIIDRLDNSGLNYTNNLTLYHRVLLPTITEVQRSTSSIPVLTDIDDKIVTSFYLDGFYWFITEHHIFGTGIGAEGQYSIEYFDPLKYWAVSETITGAMRVSDTSFWVFHNDGAYLIYKNTYTSVVDQDVIDSPYRWICTSTPKSKGCDFRNAITTLPYTASVVVVTNNDICAVEMKANIQSDDRSMVPITTSIANLIDGLLKETDYIVTGTYKYLSLFCLNPIIKSDYVPVLVYDDYLRNWWYWEFPVSEVYQISDRDDNIKILCKLPNYTKHVMLTLTTDFYLYKLGSIQYEVYCDRLKPKIIKEELTQIPWVWESAVQHFKSLDYRKQLLTTTFVFGETNYKVDDIMESNLVGMYYSFNIYAYRYSEKQEQYTKSKVERAKNNVCNTVISTFTYLQLQLKNQDFIEDEYEALSKPNISSISFKYRILPGGIT